MANGWGRNTWGSDVWNGEPNLTEGWGFNGWGETVWGDNYQIELTGVQADTAVGTVVAAIDIVVNLTGSSLQLDIGNATADGNAEVFVTAPDLLNSNTGIVTVLTTANFAVTGIQADTAVGTVDISAGGNISVNVSEHTLNSFVGQAISDAGSIVMLLEAQLILLLEQ